MRGSVGVRTAAMDITTQIIQIAYPVAITCTQESNCVPTMGTAGMAKTTINTIITSTRSISKHTITRSTIRNIILRITTNNQRTIIRTITTRIGTTSISIRSTITKYCVRRFLV